VLVAALPHIGSDAPPGTQFGYSNLGYAILGAALARAAGQPYVDYLKQRILAPLGMNDTAFDPSDAMWQRLARGYVVKDGSVDSKIPERGHQGRGFRVPNGGLYSTLEDLARFVSFQLGAGPPDVFPPEELIQSRQKIVPFPVFPGAGYGLGFTVIPAGPTLIYGHGGNVSGYDTEAHVEPRSQLGAIVLRSASGGGFATMNIVRAAFGRRKGEPGMGN
jgi:CubicO group peptidase (beta-lactamase class C family)